MRYADTCAKVLNSAPIKQWEKTRRSIVLLALVMKELENRSQQYGSGYLDDRCLGIGIFVDPLIDSQ